jgi:hypothetical protein
VGLSEIGNVRRNEINRARFFSEFSVKVGRAFVGNGLTRNKDIFVLLKIYEYNKNMK